MHRVYCSLDLLHFLVLCNQKKGKIVELEGDLTDTWLHV